MKLGTLAILLGMCAAAPLCADVTVRYQTDVTINLPAPAREQAEKSTRDAMARFGNMTLRMKNGKAWSAMGSIVSIVDYNTKQVTLIDNGRKTFSTFPLADFPGKMSVVMPKMPDEAKKAMANMKATVDSKKTGRTDTIQGIQAEENETTVVTEIPVPGNSQGGMAMKIVVRMWTASPAETMRNQAVREIAGYNLYANALMNPAGMIQKMLGSMPGTGDSFASALAELSKRNAMMLRTSMEMYMQMPPEVAKMLAEHNPAGMPMDLNAPLTSTKQEAVEVSTAPVDDSFFQVPADFQPVEAEVLIKGMMADQMSAFGNVAKPAQEPGAASPNEFLEQESGPACQPDELIGQAGTLDQKIDQARTLYQARQFHKAECLYRGILQSDPSNKTVKRLLASALFRQDKIEESSQVLNGISPLSPPKR